MTNTLDAFGKLIVDLRQKAGIATQAELARLLKVKQQSISRWEAGQSRPRDKQIPLLAAVLKADADTLLAAAGFAAKTVVVSFDQPFPIEALSPDSFERFSTHFLQAKYPEARVERAGGQGHTQDGVDVTVHFPDGTTHSFQCKRVIKFGPEKVRAVIAKHTIPAAKKILLLTKVASPQERAELQSHPEWEIWDKEDISHKIRQLPRDEQVRLVDIFFRGQRFALVGVDEAGPWETSAEFFAAFSGPEALFNHEWTLVGRQQDLTTLRDALDDQVVPAIMLMGTGGSGKSKLLKQAVQAFEVDHPGTKVRFLSRNAEISKKSLEDLGDRPKLLVVDDAHDQNDLQLLFQYAADPSNKTRLLLSLRPYGRSYISAQASTFSLLGDKIREVSLAPLSLEETEELARQVLTKYAGPKGAAKAIATFTRDCPLATVVGAQIVAKQRQSFDLAQHEDSFRKLLFARFRDVIAGEIGNKSDVANIKQVMRLLALVQPFHPEDTSLLQLMEKVESVSSHDARRLIRLLTDGGVLFKRGASYRLSPDVLADFLIEEHCIGPEGAPSGYAEKVFEAADAGVLVEHLLVNLGRLDWRRSSGDPSNSKLIDGVWRKLNPQHDYSDPHIKAVKAVAYYQPRKAIEFVDGLIRQGKFLRQLPEILRLAGYNFNYLDQACEGLWELGKTDSRDLQSAPEHPIRILAEMCEVRPNKPYDYNDKIVDFALGLFDRPESWRRPYSPLDILRAIFKTEGHTTEFHKFTMSFLPFNVSVDFVKPLRTKAFDSLLGLLASQDPRLAVLAANALGDAFRYPMGMFGASVPDQTRDAWTEVFLDQFKRLNSLLKTRILDPLVALAVWRSVAWHANSRQGSTASAARRLKQALPDSLEFRTLTVLIDGYGMEFRRIEREDHENKWAAYIERLASDLIEVHPKAEDLLAYIAKHLAHIRANSEKSATPHVLYRALIRASLDFAKVTINDAMQNERSETVQFVSMALIALWSRDPTETRDCIARLISTGKVQLRSEAAHGYAGILQTGNWIDQDLEVLRRLLADESERVIRGAIAAIRAIAKSHPSVAIELSKVANIGTSKELADDLLAVFMWGQLLRFDQLQPEDVQVFLNKLATLPDLENHWIETFLAEASKTYPKETALFFMKRVECAAETEDWNCRPANHGPYGTVPLRFKESEAYSELRVTVANWMKQNRGKSFLFQYRARELFEAMFGPYDIDTVRFLDGWVSVAESDDIELIADILTESDSGFVLTHSAFVERFLEKARSLGQDCQKAAMSALYSAAISGVRSGEAGEPMPRDVETKSQCEQILATLSRFSPAFELYDGLRKDATRDIERSLKAAEEAEE